MIPEAKFMAQITEMANEGIKPPSEAVTTFITEVVSKITKAANAGVRTVEIILSSEDSVCERESIIREFELNGYDVDCDIIKTDDEKLSWEKDRDGKMIKVWTNVIKVPCYKYPTQCGWLPAYKMKISW